MNHIFNAIMVYRNIKMKTQAWLFIDFNVKSNDDKLSLVLFYVVCASRADVPLKTLQQLTGWTGCHSSGSLCRACAPVKSVSMLR